MNFQRKGRVLSAGQRYTCFIIPEYINRRIVENGSEEQKRRAWQNPVISEQLRGRRSVAGGLFAMFATSDKLYRSIFDAENRENLPGKLVRSEGGKSKGGMPVDEAYEYSGDTYDFFSQVLDRKSIDNKGMRLDSTYTTARTTTMLSGTARRWFMVTVMATYSIALQFHLM
jgi:Zn-dependent metalloprotease